jgi:hypothetical protein
MTLMVKEHNVETGEIIEREMNAEELAQYENDQIEAKAIAAKQAETQAAKEAAQQKLSALGLTTEDLKALGL